MFVKTSPLKLIFPGLIVALGICLCMTAGCTSNSSDTTTPDASSAASPTAGATVSGAAKGSVTAVPFATLISFLPDAPAGWTAEDPVGASLVIEDGQWSWASRGYTKDDVSAMVLIQDSAYYDVGYWESWDTLVAFETTEGYYKQGKVGGYPSWEVFTKPASYATWVGLNERFMVYVSVDEGAKQDLDAFVNAVNYGSIAALK